MARRLDLITLDYWRARVAVHHPDAPDMTVEEALDLLASRFILRPEDWRLTRAMHETTYDIVEGNTEWREKRLATGSISILHTKR